MRRINSTLFGARWVGARQSYGKSVSRRQRQREGESAQHRETMGFAKAQTVLRLCVDRGVSRTSKALRATQQMLLKDSLLPAPCPNAKTHRPIVFAVNGFVVSSAERLAPRVAATREQSGLTFLLLRLVLPLPVLNDLLLLMKLPDGSSNRAVICFRKKG